MDGEFHCRSQFGSGGGQNFPMLPASPITWIRGLCITPLGEREIGSTGSSASITFWGASVNVAAVHPGARPPPACGAPGVRASKSRVPATGVLPLTRPVGSAEKWCWGWPRVCTVGGAGVWEPSHGCIRQAIKPGAQAGEHCHPACRCLPQHQRPPSLAACPKLPNPRLPTSIRPTRATTGQDVLETS